MENKYKREEKNVYLKKYEKSCQKSKSLFFLMKYSQ